MEIKKGKYSKRFQLQFSIHTTDEKLRDKIIPVKKWGFKEIAEYGMLFYSEGGRKITLNFSLADNFPVDIDILNEFFNPKLFFIKITPVNPTYSANKNKIYSENIKGKRDKIIYELKEKGYETLLSIGELEENAIGSNCGQYILRHKLENDSLNKAYTYDIKRV